MSDSFPHHTGQIRVALVDADGNHTQFGQPHSSVESARDQLPAARDLYPDDHEPVVQELMKSDTNDDENTTARWESV